MAKIHIENGIISSSDDYSLYHGTSPLATVEAGGLRVQGDIIAENTIVSSSTTYMTTSFSSGNTAFGDSTDDTHQFTGSLEVTGSMGINFPSPSAGLAVKGPSYGVSNAPIQGRNNTYGDMYLAYGSPPAYGSGKLGLHATYGLAIGTTQTEVDIGTSAGSAIEITNRDTLFQGNITGSGNISGSSTSTGSFGRLELRGDGSGTNSTISVQDGVNNGILRLEGSTRVSSPGSYIQLYGPNGSYGSAVFNYGYNTTHSELSFTVDNTERIRFGGLGEISIPSYAGRLNIGTGSAQVDATGVTSPMTLKHNLDVHFDMIATNSAANNFIRFTNEGDDDDSYAIGRNNAGDFSIQYNDQVPYGGGVVLHPLVADDTEFRIGSDISNYKISGSATSTGSFGKVVVKERVSIFSGLAIENEAALSIYSDDRKAIHIDHDDYDQPAVYIDNSNAGHHGLQVYSNLAASPTQPLVNFTVDHTSFDQNVLFVRNDGDGTGMLIDQNGNAKALEIDSEQTSNNIFHINNPAITTGTALSIEEANALTTGRIVFLKSNSSDSSTRSLFQLYNSNSSATGTTMMYLNNASTGTGIEFVGSGHAISGSSTSTGSFGSAIINGVGNNAKLTIGRANHATADLTVQDGEVQVGLGATDGYNFHDFGVNWGYKGISDGTSRLGIFTDSTERISIAGNGNIGIGVTIPGEKLTVNGNISGSSTSTGSFANLAVLDSNQGTKLGSNAINISTDGVTSRNNLAISIQGNGKIGMNMHEDGGFRSAVYFDHATDDALRFELGGGHSFVMPRLTNEFSGSASSTGSFGILETSNIRPSGGNWDSSLFVPNQLVLGSDTDTMIRKYTSNVIEFRCGGVDVARFDGSNAKFVVEGSGGIELESGNIDLPAGGLLKTDGTNVIQLSSGGANFVYNNNWNAGSNSQTLGVSIYQWKDLHLHNKIYLDKTYGASGVGTKAVELYQDDSDSANLIVSASNISLPNFTSGITGQGFRIENNGSSNGTFLEIDNIFVRNTLRTHIFQKDVVKATNGILIVSDSGVISGSTGTTSSGTVTFDNTKSATFNDNDILLFKDADDDGTVNGVRFQIDGSKSTSGDFDTYDVDNVSGNLSNLKVGGTAVRLNGGTVTIDASTTNSPFIDVNASSGSAVVRMGNLAGISTPRFGALGSEFGIWASGSAYFEGAVNATTGNIGGWGIGGNAISSSGNIISIDAGVRRIRINDGSADRIYLGEVDGNGSTLPGSPKYGLKIFDGNGTSDDNRLVELGEGANMIVGWDLIPGTIKSDNVQGSVALSAYSQSLAIWTGSINLQRPKVVVGKLPNPGGDANDDRYGLGVFTGMVDADITEDDTYTVLITRDKARLAGWDLIPGSIKSDNSFGSVALSATSQSLTIWTGSINHAEPKLVLGKLPLHDGTVDTPYGFAVFDGTGTVSGSEASASVLITANKARLAGWELVPGQLKSGTVADINGNKASIALGTNATTATGTPTDGLFFVSASSNPVFYVGKHFSYVDNVLKAGGWTIGNNVIQSTGSTADTEGITIDSNIPAIYVHGADVNDGADNQGGTDYDNVRLVLGTVADDTYGIKGYNPSGQSLFELSSAQNQIAGWEINTSFIQKVNGSDRIIFNSADVTIQLGSISAVEDITRATKGAFFSGSGDFVFKSGNTAGSNYIQGKDGNLIVSMSNFNVRANGDVSMSGEITAAGGEIAGWTLSDSALSKSSVFLTSSLNEAGLVITDGSDKILSVVSSSGLTDINDLTGSVGNSPDAQFEDNSFELGSNGNVITGSSRWSQDSVNWDTDLAAGHASQPDWEKDTTNAVFNPQCAELPAGTTIDNSSYQTIGQASFFRDIPVETDGIIAVTANLRAFDWKYYGDKSGVDAFCQLEITGSDNATFSSGTQKVIGVERVPYKATKPTFVGIKLDNKKVGHRSIRVRFRAVHNLAKATTKQYTLGGWTVDGLRIVGISGNAGTGGSAARVKPLVELNQEGMLLYSNKDSFIKLDNSGLEMKGDIDATNVDVQGNLVISGSITSTSEMNVQGAMNFSTDVALALGHTNPESKIHVSESFFNGTADNQLYPESIPIGQDISWRKVAAASYGSLAPGYAGDGSDPYNIGSVFRAQFNPFLSNNANTGQFGFTAAYGTGHIHDSYGRTINHMMYGELITGAEKGWVGNTAGHNHRMSGSVGIGKVWSYSDNKNMYGTDVILSYGPDAVDVGEMRQVGHRVLNLYQTTIDNVDDIKSAFYNQGFQVNRGGTINVDVDSSTGATTLGGFSAFAAYNNSDGTYGTTAGYGFWISGFAKNYISGKLGINDSTPNYDLHVVGTGSLDHIRVPGRSIFGNTNPGTTGVAHQFYGNSSYATHFSMYDSDGEEIMKASGTAAGGDLKFEFGDVAGAANGTIYTVDDGNTKHVFDGGFVDITNTTDATDATGDTGALRVEGGASIANKVFVGTDLDVGGTYTNDTQPAFLALNSSTDSNLATNTLVKIEFDSEVYDQASNYNTTTDTFTAPVTGKYLLTTTVRLDQIDTGASWVSIRIVTSNREYRRFIDPNFSADLNQFGMSMTAIADMDASDTAHVEFKQSGGTAQVDVNSGNPGLSPPQLDTFFSGYLLG